jgi:ribonuclease P protein component
VHVARRAVIASRSERAALTATESVSLSGAAPLPAGSSAARGAVSIPGPVGFDHCLKRPALLRLGVFAFHVVAVEASAWRLGLVIPKRFEQSAVTRNSIKRRWREAFRVRRGDWTDEFGGADLVIRMTAPLVAKRDPKSAEPALTSQQRARFDAGALLTTFAERMRKRRPQASS